MKEDEELSMILDPISLFFGGLGMLVCVGVITLRHTHTTTALIGLMLIVVAKCRLFSVPITLRGISRSSYLTWLTIIVGYSLLVYAGTVHALYYLLTS